MESMEKTLRNDLFFDGADMTIDALSSALRLQIALLTQLSWLPHKKEGEACRKLVGKQHINWHRLLPHPLSGRAIYFLSSKCSDMILFVALVAHKAANDSRIIKFYGNVSLKGNLWSNDIDTNIHYVLKVTAVRNILEWAFNLDDAFAAKYVLPCSFISGHTCSGCEADRNMGVFRRSSVEHVRGNVCFSQN